MCTRASQSESRKTIYYILYNTQKTASFAPRHQPRTAKAVIIILADMVLFREFGCTRPASLFLAHRYLTVFFPRP